MKILVSLLALYLFISCKSDHENNKKNLPEVRIPDFFDQNGPKAEVLLLGTFHFKDAGADDYKPKFQVDIMSEKRQSELEDLLKGLEKFNPTKIIVEAKTHQQSKLDSLYLAYQEGRFELRANEIFQIAFRLANRLGHKKLIAGDVYGREYEYIRADFEAYKKRVEDIQKEESLTAILESNYGEQYTKLYSYLDSLKMIMTLKDFLLLENQDSILSIKHGHYLLGSIGTNNGEEYPVADNLSGWWYNRNLRIVSNIRKSIRSPEERVLVIFGAGHMPIIKHALKASPEIRVVELEEFF